MAAFLQAINSKLKLLRWRELHVERSQNNYGKQEENGVDEKKNESNS